MSSRDTAGRPASDYTPIACSAYDVLEAAAVRRVPLRLRLREGREAAEITAVVLDLFARDRTEFARLHIGTAERVVRLDAIEHIVDTSTGAWYATGSCSQPQQHNPES
jgi:transcriptional antiterminator Rof (Rho-off)